MTKKITKLMLNGQEYEIREYQGGGGGGRQPGANTTLYLPLNGDITDPYNQVTYNWVGTSSFATWSTGVQAANFTGSNAVALGTSKDFINGTGEYTVLFWFTTTSPSTEQRCSFNVSGKYFMINSILNGKLAGQVYTSSNEYTVSGTTSIVANTKYLAAITRKENGKMCVYLNGNLEGQTNISGTFKSLSYQFGQHIGAGREGNNAFWEGMIKDFIIENKERTAQEILDYYNATKDNYSSSTPEPEPEPEPQVETCHRCEGTGEVDCDMCGGTGQEMCPTCQGTGQVGDPEDPESRTPCPDCDGGGFISCGNCGGTGKVTCEWCGGTGEEPGE